MIVGEIKMVYLINSEFIEPQNTNTFKQHSLSINDLIKFGYNKKHINYLLLKYDGIEIKNIFFVKKKTFQEIKKVLLPLILKYNVNIDYVKYNTFYKVILINDYWITGFIIQHNVDFEFIKSIYKQLKCKQKYGVILFANEKNKLNFIEELMYKN